MEHQVLPHCALSHCDGIRQELKNDVEMKHYDNLVIFGKQLTMRASELAKILPLPPPQSYLSLSLLKSSRNLLEKN